MPHSNYTDVYKGVRYEIKFFKFENGFTAEIHITDLPVIKDSDSLWATRDSAVISTVNEAHRIIDNLSQ